MAHSHGFRRANGPLTRDLKGLRGIYAGRPPHVGGERRRPARIDTAFWRGALWVRTPAAGQTLLPSLARVRSVDGFGKLPRTARRPAAEPLLDAERAPDEHRERPGCHEQPDDEEAERVDVQALHPGPERPAEAELLTEQPR